MKDFLTYIRTRQVQASANKDYDANRGIKVCITELKGYGVKLPMHGIKHTIVDDKIYCLCTIPGNIDLSLLKPKNHNIESIHKVMWNCLRHCDISPRALLNESNCDWFKCFLQYKHRPDALDFFLNVDNFANRVHTPVSTLKRDYRPHLTLLGESTSSLDVAQMQPSLLALILEEEIGRNNFSDHIRNGNDIYLMIQEKANLLNRDKAKKYFFEILYGKPNDNLTKLFGHENWISWINRYKSIYIQKNPHSAEKPHSNLAWKLQNFEVLIMKEVWIALAENKIPFLTVHDEIIVREADCEKARIIFGNVLAKHLPYYKINKK